MIDLHESILEEFAERAAYRIDDGEAFEAGLTEIPMQVDGGQ